MHKSISEEMCICALFRRADWAIENSVCENRHLSKERHSDVHS